MRRYLKVEGFFKPKKEDLRALNQKGDESFSAYVGRWRDVAAQMRNKLDEEKQINMVAQLDHSSIAGYLMSQTHTTFQSSKWRLGWNYRPVGFIWKGLFFREVKGGTQECTSLFLLLVGGRAALQKKGSLDTGLIQCPPHRLKVGEKPSLRRKKPAERLALTHHRQLSSQTRKIINQLRQSRYDLLRKVWSRPSCASPFLRH